MKLHTRIAIGLGIGLGLGLLFNRQGWQETTAFSALDTIGSLFLKLIRMVVVPLIFASIVHAVATLGDLRRLRRIGGLTLGYYLLTTSIAVVIGLVLVNLIQPGVGASLAGAETPERAAAGPPTGSELITRVVPDNPFDALVRSDVLQIIFFGIILGIALGVMGERAATTLKVFEEINQAIIVIIDWLLQLIPIGVAALMARAVGAAGVEALVALGKYMATVLAGLGIHGLIVLPLIVWLVGRVRPWRLFGGVSEALAMAFSTASSSATLPVTMEALHDNVGVSRRITRFVLPLGATINMDGTALYEAVAAMFIAQAYAKHLGMNEQVMVALTATLAAIGAAGIPEAGLFTMVIVLQAVHLPLEGIGLILAVDRVLDMCRTTVNVLGDAVGGVCVGRLEGELGNEASAVVGDAN